MVLDSFQDIFDSMPQNTTLNLPVCKENTLDIKFGTNSEVKAIFSGSGPVLPFASSDVFKARILNWKRLTAVNDDCKPVYEISFDVQDSNYSFKAGDTIGIIPKNEEEDVNFILTQLGLSKTADVRYTLRTESRKSKIPLHIPVESTIRHVLTHCVDLRSVLKKLFLLALSQHTKDEHERRILEYFCSKEGSTAYQNHILNKGLCILDIFAIFKSCKPPVQILLSNLPRLLPRPYSIVNSGIKNAKILKICFSVLTAEKNTRRGLTTGWLESLILDHIENRMKTLAINDCDMYRIPIYLRQSNGFCLPDNIEKPLILIGPGTGVAPFLSFLEERQHYKSLNPRKTSGDIWLFFGCRNPELDFIYEKQLRGYLQDGVLTELITAFSRVEDSKYKYIQDALKDNAEAITKLIEADASIFVCGDLKTMAGQVKDVITECLINSGKSEEEANIIISNLQNDKKYVVDAWS